MIIVIVIFFIFFFFLIRKSIIYYITIRFNECTRILDFSFDKFSITNYEITLQIFLFAILSCNNYVLIMKYKKKYKSWYCHFVIIIINCAFSIFFFLNLNSLLKKHWTLITWKYYVYLIKDVFIFVFSLNKKYYLNDSWSIEYNIHTKKY